MLSAFIGFPALISRICHFAPFETWVLFALGLSPGIAPVLQITPLSRVPASHAGRGRAVLPGWPCICHAGPFWQCLKAHSGAPLPPECSSAHCMTQMIRAQSASPLPCHVLHPGSLGSWGRPQSQGGLTELSILSAHARSTARPAARSPSL